jgi:hypothetical protein
LRKEKKTPQDRYSQKEEEAQKEPSQEEKIIFFILE